MTNITNVETINGEDVENTYGITFTSIESATAWLENNGGGSIRVEDEAGDWDIITVTTEETVSDDFFDDTFFYVLDGRVISFAEMTPTQKTFVVQNNLTCFDSYTEAQENL